MWLPFSTNKSHQSPRRLKVFGISLEGRPEDLPSLHFLRAATQIATSKEIEPVVLHMLVKWQSTTHDEEKMRFVSDLRKLERIAMWMMLVAA